MSYLSNFERSFSDHTLKLVEAYGSGPHDVTLLVNCLLGLLVVPKETALDAVPEDPLSGLIKWGIDPRSIRNPGRQVKGRPDPNTLRGLVANLRHAVAHFNIKPLPAAGDVTAFEYTNDSGLHAVISVDEMREFVRRLSKHLAQ
ncbi:MAG: HEPN family nuclease [Betaproteobacteria bacterium]